MASSGDARASLPSHSDVTGLAGQEHSILAVHVLAQNARSFAASTAVVCGDRRLTWRELHEEVNRAANAMLALGLGKGDKVALFLSNSVEFLICFWGVVRAGCVVVPINTLLDDSALARVLAASDAQVIIADESTIVQADRMRGDLAGIATDRFFSFAERPGWLDAAALIRTGSVQEPEVDIEPGDTMTVMFTSGTTGVPKGIEHTHRARMLYPLGFGMGLKVDRYSISICPTPMHASGSWITLFPVMYRGGTVVLMPRFTPEEFLELVEREGATHTFLVPTMFIDVLQSGALAGCDVSSMRALVTSGQTLATHTREAVSARFPNSGLYESYGFTEGAVTLRIPEDAQYGKVDSVGKPLLLDEVRILDPDSDRELGIGQPGEIAMTSLGMMKGYYNDSDRTRSVVWRDERGRIFVRSGDTGYLDEDGFLYVSGRLKDMIKSGGINIYAVDIEDVFMEHPEVREAAAIGVAHPRWIETPVLVAVLVPGSTVAASALQDWGNERLGRYQRVSRVIVTNELPRSTYGKVHKDRLREQHSNLFRENQ